MRRYVVVFDKTKHQFVRVDLIKDKFILAKNGVNVLPWPAVSPNQNPIDHIWEELGRRVRNNHRINNVNDLRHVPQPLAEMQIIPSDVIRRLTIP
jgi:hypothetical protein